MPLKACWLTAIAYLDLRNRSIITITINYPVALATVSGLQKGKCIVNVAVQICAFITPIHLMKRTLKTKSVSMKSHNISNYILIHSYCHIT